MTGRFDVVYAICRRGRRQHSLAIVTDPILRQGGYVVLALANEVRRRSIGFPQC